jgi:L-aspartate oxidase
VVAGALARHESRGGHYRSDYPQTDEHGARTFMTMADADRIAGDNNASQQPSCAVR